MNIFSIFFCSSSKHCCQSWKKPTSEWNLWCDTMEATREFESDVFAYRVSFIAGNVRIES